MFLWKEFLKLFDISVMSELNLLELYFHKSVVINVKLLQYSKYHLKIDINVVIIKKTISDPKNRLKVVCSPKTN